MIPWSPEYHQISSVPNYQIILSLKKYFTSIFLNNMLRFESFIFKSSSTVALFQASPSILEQVCKSLRGRKEPVGEARWSPSWGPSPVASPPDSGILSGCIFWVGNVGLCAFTLWMWAQCWRRLLHLSVCGVHLCNCSWIHSWPWKSKGDSASYFWDSQRSVMERHCSCRN